MAGKGGVVRLCRVECFGSWLTLTHVSAAHSLSHSVVISLCSTLASPLSLYIRLHWNKNMYLVSLLQNIAMR